MAELHRPRPTDPSDSPTPPPDAPSPGTRDDASPRNGTERKAALLDARASALATGRDASDDRTDDAPSPAHPGPADRRDPAPRPESVGDQPTAAHPPTSAERKAALLDNRAAALDRAPATDRPPTPTTARPTTDLDRKLDRLEAAALTRNSASDAPEPPRRAPAERPDTPTRGDADGPRAPEIREKVYEHILHGEWNKRGKPVGFHSAPDGQPPADRRIVNVERQYASGIYLADAEFRHPTSGEWTRKRTQEHTMFPDSWSEQKVRTAVTSAYQHAYSKEIEPKIRSGESVTGAPVEGSYEDVRIGMYVGPNGELRTAFPIRPRELGDINA